ncbi:MAG: UvrD-helicase domain-containing protein [Treponema sp.]|nr:UvrD-helicase domain-containing protein [Treponema sp.]
MIEHKRDSFELDNESLRQLSANLNDEQLSAVKETRNVVVSAGAGSGKTTVLASRYAYLVEAKNVPCEKILTLTFTKKAANEMKERIFNGLRSHLHGKDVKGKADLSANLPHLAEIKARAKTAIESFDKTHIQTLDSYFSEIAKKGARYYGINPNFSLDDEKITNLVNYKATKYVLEHLESAEIKEIAQVFEIQNVASDLFASSILKFSTILTPIDFAESLQKQKNAILSEYEKVTAQIADEIGSFILLPRNPKASPTLLNLYNYIEEIGNPDAPRMTAEIFENGENADSFLKNNFSSYCKDVSGYCGTNFSRVGDANYKQTKKNLLPLLERLYLLANSIAGFALIKKIFAHLALFQNEVIRTKRSSGLLSFGDVSELAFASLREHEEIRHIEQQKFDAIMIDEFQDDNQLQCDVLLILSDAHEKYDENGNYSIPKLSDSDLLERLDTHKLFFVGDDKQSIYRFRGADVSVFRNLSSSIQNEIQLKTNYRSEPELIRGFNTIFGGYDYPNGEKVNDALPALFMTKEKFSSHTDESGLTEAEGIPDFEADYKRVEVPEFKLKDCDFSEKKITLALYPKKDEEAENQIPLPREENARAESENPEADRKVYECEASFVASEIKKLLEETDKGGNQKYHYRDIALLFRTATPTAAYENVLLGAGIPYSTEVYKGFFSDGPINDIISLLKLCVYPEDKNAYAKVLRSPFCSLTFAELEKILVNTESPYKSPFDEKMLAAISDDSDLTAKIMNLKAIYDDINVRLKTEKLTKTISYIWYELGYRYETLWNKTVSLYASFYDILFEMARLAEDKTQSLASFIDMVKSYEDADQKLDGLDVIMDAEDAVQILTVHKSKGLEFKVVFVCAVSGKSNPPPAKIGYATEFGFLLKTPAWQDYQKAALKISKAESEKYDKNYFFALTQEQNERQESAELRRLAYVAFTRAEEKLYIIGSENGEFKKDELAETAAPKNIYQLLLPILFEGVAADENGGTTVKNPAFNFVNDKDSFKPVAKEDEKTLEKSSFIAQLSDSETVEVERETLSPKVYVSPSKLKVENGNRERRLAGKTCETGFERVSEQLCCEGENEEGKSPANFEYELINKIVASTVPSGEVLDLEDEGGESDNEIAPLFNFTNFGTIAHAYMEGKVLGAEPKISGREWIGMNEKFISGVGMEKWAGETNREKKIAKIRELCADMARRFDDSALYKEAFASPWKKSEYSFRSVVEKSFVAAESEEMSETYADELIVNGQIDLVYQNADDSKYKFTIVDYKTNQKIEPEIYYAQLACYRKAVSQMLACAESEIRCVLYYLRFAEEVDITEEL